MGLHCVDSGDGADAARAACDVEPAREGRRQRAAADLHEHGVGHGALERVDHLPHERFAALDGEGAVRALAAERRGAPGDRVAKGEVGRIAGHRGVAGARVHRRPELAKLFDNRRVGPRRDEDVERATRCTGHDRRRQGRVAAARDGEARWRGGC